MKNKTTANQINLYSFFPYILAGIILVSIFSEFYLGRSFAISILVGTSSFLFILLALSEKKIVYPKPQAVLFIIFLGWCLLVTFSSIDITESMWEILRNFGVFLLFLNAFNIVKIENDAGKILKILSLAGGLLVFINLLTFISSGALGKDIFFSGFLSWHNQMAGFLIATVPLLIVSVKNFKKNYLKIFGCFLIGIESIALVLTYSRGGWIIFISQMVAIFFLMKKGAKKYFLAFMALFLIFLGIFTFSTPSLENRIRSIPLEYTSLGYINQTPRLYTWQTGLEIFSDHPFMGVGPGAFGQIFANYQSQAWLYSLNAHNHFLQVLVETGIVGFVIFLALILTCIKPLLKNDFKKNILLGGTLISILGLIMHSLIDYDFSTVVLYSIFWLLMGLGLALTKAPVSIFYLKGKNNIIYILILIILVFTSSLTISEDAYFLAKYSLISEQNKVVKNSLERSITFNPFNGKSYILASQFFYGQKDKEKAKEMANKSIKLLPYETSPYTVLGAIEADRSNFKKSEELYRKAIAKRPFSDPNSYIGLSFSLEKQGKSKEAEKLLTEAIDEKFPINSTYKGFENAYFITGLTNDLGNLYIALARLKLADGKQKEADTLFRIVNDRLKAPVTEK